MQEISAALKIEAIEKQSDKVVGKLSWREVLKDHIDAEYFKNIQKFVKTERALGKAIYPAHQDMFNALKFTEFDQLKVVIIGQDPYHGLGQAHGLCFSVKHGVKPPPSLVNIFKEIKADLGLEIPQHGCLENWAKQGVLLLNTILSVEANKPASHQHLGWQTFTTRIIESISQHKTNIIFLLWGAHAQKMIQYIDQTKHHVLTAPHPSPFSAHSGFFGCKHFSKTNQILNKLNQKPIDWRI